MRPLSRSARSLATVSVLGAVLAAGALTAGSADPRAQPVQEAEPGLGVGATFHGFWNYDTEAEASTALRMLKDAGGTWVRIDLGWEAVEPEPDAYSTWALEEYDDAIDAAHEEGLKVLLVFQRTPAWANGVDDETVAPEDVSDFGDFAVDITNRYAGKVQAVELWNEPNSGEFFQAQEEGQEAAEHAAMVKDAYTKIRECGPQGDDAVTVLAGGSTHVDVAWWEELYAEGIRDYTDVVAVNPYSIPSDLPPGAEPDGTRYRLHQLAELIQLMDSRDDGAKPIWFTEFGWSAHPNEPGAAHWELGVTPEQQADFFEQTIGLVQEDYPQVEQVFWYNLRDRDDVDSLHQTNFGLLERDLTPKPVLERMAEVVGGE